MRSRFVPILLAAYAACACILLVACQGLPLILVDPFKAEYTEKTFVNWESPHVSPIALSIDGRVLLAVNTADARLEFFDVGGDAPTLRESIPVGLDPVSVRFRSDAEAWVANHVSDSISIVDLSARSVVRTLQTADEPTDIAFAAGRAFVTCSQANEVCVFDLADLDAAPAVVAIEGEDPRALAVSADGKRIYAAIFESGNHSTLVPWEMVSDPTGPYGGANPPPNQGALFDPPLNPDLPAAPPVSLIVKRDPRDGFVFDELGSAWNGSDSADFVTWDQHDHDIAIIDTATLHVSYIRSVMNANMQLATFGNEHLVVIGTDATNEIRFEPNLNGRFVRSVAALVRAESNVSGAGNAPATQIDLNPHLTDAYATKIANVASDVRSRSIAVPRGVAVSHDAARVFIAGMGSNNLIAMSLVPLDGMGEPWGNDGTGSRIGQIGVGQGPTGVVLDESRSRAYVLNKFDASISVVDIADASQMREVSRLAFFDPTPASIKLGRPFFYDAHATSGLGVTSCGACHIDARTDQLAWDLGNPAGSMKAFDQECNHPFLNIPVGECEDFHPMKGPMTTQTMQNIVGTEPFHWRGDKQGIEEFNAAFVNLLGGDRELTDPEMQLFKDFLRNIVFPPNPNRTMENGLKSQVGDGDPLAGEKIFFNQGIDLSFAKCNDCHETYERGAGTNHKITPRNLLINPHQSIDVPQIRNQYEKSGFSRTRQDNSVGFGHNHDGTLDGLVNFFHIPNFTGFAEGERGEKQRRDVISYVMSFSTDTHAGVGAQVTLSASNRGDAGVAARLESMLAVADRGEVGLIAKSRVNARTHGFVYVSGGEFESDAAVDGVITVESLLATVAAGREITFTLVPLGTQRRMGIDRDADGVRDADE